MKAVVIHNKKLVLATIAQNMDGDDKGKWSGHIPGTTVYAIADSKEELCDMLSNGRSTYVPPTERSRKPRRNV